MKTPRIVAASAALASLIVASVSSCSGAPEDGPASTSDAAAPTDAAAPRDANTGSDAGRPDGAGSDASMDSGRLGPTGIVVDLVNASPDATSIGFCLGGIVGGNVVFPPGFDRVLGPLPRFAASQVKVPDSLTATMQSTAVRVYAVPGYTRGDAGASSCASVIAADSGSGAVLLKELPSGTFQIGKGFIVAVVGCSEPTNRSVARCGADPSDATKPLAQVAWFRQFDRTFVAGDRLGAQFVHLSPQVANGSFLPDGGRLDAGANPVPAFGSGIKVAVGTPNIVDGGVTYNWAAWASGASPINFGSDPSPLVSAAMPIDPNTLALGLATANAGSAPATADILATFSLRAAAEATLGASSSSVSTYFKAGYGYTFFAVGDLTESADSAAPNGGPDYFRFLALPNNPIASN